MRPEYRKYDVIVGNIGTVRRDVGYAEAHRTATEYAAQARTGKARAEFPIVVMGNDGEIYREVTR